jgi:hypothetical protein
MPMYAAYLGTENGAYRDLEELVEADDPRGAAQQVIDSMQLHPDEEFPELLIVPEDQVHIFTRDDAGRAVTPDEDMPRLIRREPQTVKVEVRPDELDRLRDQP